MLANSLGMFFVDIGDMLSYNLINAQMLSCSGQKYFEKQKQKTICSFLDYENTLATGDIKYFLGNQNLQKFAQTYIILYLEIDASRLNALSGAQNAEKRRPPFAIKEECQICKRYANVKILSTGNIDNDVMMARDEVLKLLEDF